MNEDQEGFRSFVVSFYVWVISVFFGGTLLDLTYSNLLPGRLDPYEIATVFSNASDFLLLIGFVTIISAIGAIIVSWKSTVARNLFIGSLLIIGFEFLIPILRFSFTQNAGEYGAGPWLRIVPSGLASILALIGLHKYYRKN